MAEAETLPQLDASSLVDGERLEAAVKDMYRHVARGDDAALHFEVGRSVAGHLGYPAELLDAIPAEALASFAGVGHHLDLAAIRPGEAVLDLGSGSGTDVFCAAVLVGPSGRVAGVDITDEQLAKAARLRDRAASPRSSSSRRTSRRSPSRTRASTSSSPTASSTSRSPSTACSPRRRGCCARAAGSPIADIVSGRALKARTRRNVDLWAACVAGAIPRRAYLEAIAAQGLEVREVRRNDYRFVSDRALEACSTYEVESISLVAVKPL